MKLWSFQVDYDLSLLTEASTVSKGIYSTYPFYKSEEDQRHLEIYLSCYPWNSLIKQEIYVRPMRGQLEPPPCDQIVFAWKLGLGRRELDDVVLLIDTYVLLTSNWILEHKPEQWWPQCVVYELKSVMYTLDQSVFSCCSFLTNFADWLIPHRKEHQRMRDRQLRPPQTSFGLILVVSGAPNTFQNRRVSSPAAEATVYPSGLCNM